MIKSEYPDAESIDDEELEEIMESVFPDSTSGPNENVIAGHRTADTDLFREEKTGRREERERVKFAQIRDDIDLIRRDIETLRNRLAVVVERAATVVQSRAEWADAAAHAQLGDYPWAKLAGAMIGAFVGARFLRRLPVAALTTAAAPAVLAALQKSASN
ncbi:MULTISPECIES: hypothetical protein [unclassified Rhizobium]|uniref:hypothetical protein n=1 Tax=unclassified Rhizobium TaxID=2613769 RepID=UPI0016202589|nr:MULTISPECIES: hypothetical protein [unclassified Rhizobium]MBB3545436.1 hypothetical protein [Rhizobium sp. BK399]MCS4096442.1 hypothetical protein [Rhizobium sp. BK176]